MKIVRLTFEIIRATPAVAEFHARVQLDGPPGDCEIKGRVMGPRSPTVPTIEVSYPASFKEVYDDNVVLRFAVPEPNLWTPEAPFTYEVTVDLYSCGLQQNTRTGVVAFRSLY